MPPTAPLPRSAQLAVESSSLPPCFSPQVILKDLEVLAEIASSPAGQTDDPGPLDGPDLRASHSELQVPTPGRAGLLNTSGKFSPEGSSLRGLSASAGLGLDHGGPLGCCSGALELGQDVRGLWVAAGNLPPQEPPEAGSSHPLAASRDPHRTFSAFPCTFDAFEPLTKHKTIWVGCWSLCLGSTSPVWYPGALVLGSHRWNTRWPFPFSLRS